MFTIDSQLTETPTATLNELQAARGRPRARLPAVGDRSRPTRQSATRPAFDATDPAAYPATRLGGVRHDRPRPGRRATSGIDLALAGPLRRLGRGHGRPKYDRNENRLQARSRPTYEQWVQRGRDPLQRPLHARRAAAPLPRVTSGRSGTSRTTANLAPQATDRSTSRSPAFYRGLLDAGFQALTRPPTAPTRSCSASSRPPFSARPGPLPWPASAGWSRCGSCARSTA